MPGPDRRDVAVVLSGGGINGVLLELGFLERLREDPLWERVGWIYGTSAGALCGTMAALDRLPDLEQFLLELRAEDAFRPRRIWQLPFGGLHDYTLPATIADRIGDDEEIGSALASGRSSSSSSPPISASLSTATASGASSSCTRPTPHRRRPWPGPSSRPRP